MQSPTNNNPSKSDVKDKLLCWCGTEATIRFSEDYFQCCSCGSLISIKALNFSDQDSSLSVNEFYGREYWFDHQVKELSLPNIIERSRIDLADRCLFWLKELLKRKLPPANILEIGCSHGGGLALQKMAGYEALGIELSPWVVNFARETFEVDVQIGPVEKLNLVPNSFDVITMFDVIEHLEQPRLTIDECAKLLKQDGLLIIQTPNVPPNQDYDALVQEGSQFLQMLIKEEHLFLFNNDSITRLLKECGFCNVSFVEPLFKHDMFLVVSKTKLPLISSKKMTNSLFASPSGRIVLGMLDLKERIDDLSEALNKSERDRAARLEAINRLSLQLEDSERDRAARLEAINRLSLQLEESERDRAARLEVINRLSLQLEESDAKFKRLISFWPAGIIWKLLELRRNAK